MSNAKSGGIGVLGFAFLVMLVAKLVGIGFSDKLDKALPWLLVFSPILLGLGIVLIAFVVIVLAAIFGGHRIRRY